MSASERTERVLVVEDDADLRSLLVTEIGDADYVVRHASSAEEARGILSQWRADLIVSDLRLPGADGQELLRHTRSLDPAPAFVVVTAFGTIEKAVACVKEGADDFLAKPLDLDHLMLVVERTLRTARLEREVHRLREQVGDHDFHGMVGRSAPMRELFQQIRQVARAQGPVLVQGDSGTGKELVARAVHAESPRADGPFLAVNCAGVPRDLLESEFFGHAEGAFTGASRDREGMFAEADGGTLLLDEVAEMPIDLQAKLLRVLQEGEIRRVGDNRVRPVDVRIVASTNRDAGEEVAAGRFREDLYFRLQTFVLEVPSLRERGQDLDLLAAHFLNRHANRMGREIDRLESETLERLRSYPYPGNVRELENAIERAVAYSQGDAIAVEDLPPRIRDHEGGGSPDGGPALTFTVDGTGRVPPLEEVEQRYIRHVLEAAGGNKRKAASLLGIGRRTLYRKLDRDGG